jgi:hypothetical protein
MVKKLKENNIIMKEKNIIVKKKVRPVTSNPPGYTAPPGYTSPEIIHVALANNQRIVRVITRLGCVIYYNKSVVRT